MNCTTCGKPLTGGVDTYGDWVDPLCWSCFWEDHEQWKLSQELHDAFLLDLMEGVVIEHMRQDSKPLMIPSSRSLTANDTYEPESITT